jgi:hypothetical protein
MRCKFRRLVCTATALGALAAMGGFDAADATNRRDGRRGEPQSRAGGTPLLAIVSLNQQRVSIYDAENKILQSPVSTGSTSYETPVGIYSVVQKKEVHQSNVYEDGNMPFMQRITWTGVALHAGALPGYPASHGCVRLPLPFAQRLFGLTDIGLRVLVVRDDIAPADISHPALFKPNPARREAMLTPPVSDRLTGGQRATPVRSDVGTDLQPGSARYLEQLRARAAALSSEADAATRKVSAAKQAAARKAAEAAPAVKAVRAMEGNLETAQAALKGVERAVEAAVAAVNAANEPAPSDAPNSADAAGRSEAAKERAQVAKEKAEQSREKALSNIADAQSKLEAAKAQAQAKRDAADRAAEELKAAEAARDQAVEAAAEASRKTFPISVFISRKTQRLYVRQGYHPIYERAVAIRDADKPIGTFVFTAKQYVDDGADVRWGVVSMYAGNKPGAPAGQEADARRRTDTRPAEALPADVAGARAALDRVEIPREVVEHYADVVLPGSSLIISDEGLSLETGKDTDFVVLMSGEPQGGIKTRRREQPRYRDDDDYWGGGRRGGGFFSLFFN